MRDNPTALAACVNSASSSIQSGTSVSLVTYLDSEQGSSFDIPDIIKFGSYMLANTAAYAEQNNYRFRWLNAKTGSNYQPGDARWNKVKIIETALDPVSGWAKDSEFLVWLDADAIVIDLGLKIEEIGAQYPQADFIASADIRQGYLNSGFLIMRNTAWLRDFVRKWWTVVDRTVKCDQDAFDILYESYQALHQQGDEGIGNIREKVAILDRDALNSDPPAMTNQKDYNQVLHLMGEITPQRRAVFSKAFTSICETTLSPNSSNLPIQLGVNREFLLESASTVYSAHVEELMIKASQISPRPTVEAFNELSVACHHLSDIYSTINTEETKSKYQTLYKRAYEITIDWLRDFEAYMQASSSERNSLITTYIYMLKRAAENGNDYFHSLSSTDLKMKKTVSNEVFQILRVLHNILSESSKPFALHMTSLMYHNLGELMYNAFIRSEDKKSGDAISLLEEGLTYESKAIETMSINFEETDNKAIAREFITMLQLTAIFQCTLHEYKDAINTWNRTIEKAEKLAGGIVISYHFHHLIGYYFNAGMCDYTNEHYVLAKKRFLRVLEVAGEIEYDPKNIPREIVNSRLALEEINNIARRSPELMNPYQFNEDETMDEWEECEPGDKDCEEVEVDENGQVISPLGSPRIVRLDELDEWEECSSEEEGCEIVEIDEILEEDDEDEDQELTEIREQYAKQSQRFHQKAPDAGETDVEDDEEAMELAEIRAQYAKQSQRFQGK